MLPTTENKIPAEDQQGHGLEKHYTTGDAVWWVESDFQTCAQGKDYAGSWGQPAFCSGMDQLQLQTNVLDLTFSWKSNKEL